MKLKRPCFALAWFHVLEVLIVELLIVTRESKDSRVQPGLASPSPPSMDSPREVPEVIVRLWADLEPWIVLSY